MSLSSCKILSTFSITMMASSTTIPMASMSAKRVIKFILNPIAYSPPKVPMMDTGTASIGMTVARKLFKNIYITMITRIMASMKVFITSWIETSINSVGLYAIVCLKPAGKFLLSSSSFAFTACAVARALASFCIKIKSGTASLPFSIASDA